ncbi:MAG: ribonuclease Z [Lachnospiraceae bacterium]|nr:ribonuclease Z [Lachnospiraceae bacterium]
MIVIICIDEKKGMMFHNRRQSQDRILREHIIKECKGRKLYMNPYSYHMFKQNQDASIVVSEHFLEQAGTEAYCFVENQNICHYLDKIQEIVLYQWNRHYPADTYFTVDLSDGNWDLVRTEEFKGSSHEKITREVYKKIR